MREIKIIKEASEMCVMSNWKNCVAINQDGKAMRNKLGEGEMENLVTIISALPPSWN